MAWVKTESGLRVWVKDDGKALVRDAGGKVYSTSIDKAERLVLDQGYSSASPEQRAEQVEAIKHGDIAGQAKAGAKALAAGVVDVGAAGYRVGEAVGEKLGKTIGRQMGISEAELERRARTMPRISQALGGREIQENVAWAVGELGGEDQGEVAAREYREASQAQARQNPLTTEGAYLAGQILPTLAIPGAGAAIGRLGTAAKVGLGALEGAGQGASQVTEDAWIKDQESTAEHVLAGTGLGAVLGGGVTFGLHGAGRLFRRSGSRGTTPFDAAIPGTSKVARDQAATDIAESALGEAPTKETVGWLRRQFNKGVEKYEDLSAVVTGASKEDLKALRMREVMRTGAESPFERFDKREVIRAQYTEELAAVQQRVQEAEQRLFKQNIIEARKADQMRLLVDSSEGALERQRAAVADYATSIERAADDMSSNPRTYGERSWLEPMRAEVDRLRQQLVDPRADGADLFTAVDRIKRKMDRYVRKARGQQARGSGDFAKDFQAGNLAERLAATQEPIRRGLMDPAVWGKKAAASQQEINAAWESHLGDVAAGITDPNESYLRGFFSRHKGLYEDELPTFRVEKPKVLAFLREMGSEASVTARDTEAQMLRQLDTGTELAKQLDKHYVLGPALKQDLDEIVGGNQQIRQILDRIRDEMKTFQQIDRLEAHQGIGGVGVGAVGGGVLGGPVGAAAGAAFGAANMPVRIARQAWALKAMANNVQRRLRGTVAEVAGEGSTAAYAAPKTLQELKARIGARRAEAAARQAAQEEYEAGLGPWGAVPSSPSAPTKLPERAAAPEIFGPRAAGRIAGEATRRAMAHDDRDDWRDQAELVMNFSDSERTANQISLGLGSLAEDMPAMAGAITGKAAIGARYLADVLGPMIPPRSPLQPNVPLRRLPDDDQAKWDRIWDAVNDPSSVLEDWRTGRVKQDQLDALKAVWPRTFQDLQEHTAELIGQRKTPLDYDQRRQIALLLDLGGMLEPTLDPGFLARTNEWYAATKQKTQPSPPPTGKAPKLSSLHDLNRRET